MGADHIWRPFTQHQTADEPLMLRRGEGAVVTAADGRSYLDLTSSWWVTVHGHCHPAIAAAIARQARTLEHALAADCATEPSARLARSLIEMLKADRIFFSDNGSTAVEVALKIAWQYWQNRKVKDRRRFIAFDGGYHGDTLGALSAGFSVGFYQKFKDLRLDRFRFAPYPATWDGDNRAESKEKAALRELERLFAAEGGGDKVAAVIIEPLLQGAAGMRVSSPQFVAEAVRVARRHGALVIFDEVMTGFGRTGSMFAQDQLPQEARPDITCLAKGLSGGFLPIAATSCRDEVFRSFLGQDFSAAFAHGHSYAANPIAAAAANASLRLFAEEDSLRRVAGINAIHRKYLPRTKKFGATKQRSLGAMAAFDLNLQKRSGEYGGEYSLKLKKTLRAKGLLMRPLANTLYLLPPYAIGEEQLAEGWQKILETLAELDD